MWTLQFLGKFQGLLPLLLRAMVGAPFALSHGYGKLFPGGSFDGGSHFVNVMAKGTAPPFLLYIGAWTEFLAGLGILAGLLTRWAAIGIIAVMTYAVFGVHWAKGFSAPEGYEMALLYATMSFCILAVGPGSLSLDRLFFQKAALNP